MRYRPVPKYGKFRLIDDRALNSGNTFAMHMPPTPPSQPLQQKISRELCKHPQVQIVSRDEDAEYVECKECGEVFESSELKDMAIEERKDADEE
ncbi:MAG: hypothetical protein WBS24_07780 [Terriglobales bacterium]